MERAEITGRLVRGLTSNRLMDSHNEAWTRSHMYPLRDKLWPNERSVNRDSKRQWFSFTSFLEMKIHRSLKVHLRVALQGGIWRNSFWQGKKGRKDEQGKKREWGKVVLIFCGGWFSKFTVCVWYLWSDCTSPPLCESSRAESLIYISISHSTLA